jgi:hypothetical protein
MSADDMDYITTDELMAAQRDQGYDQGYKDGYEDGRDYEKLDHNCYDVCEECGDLDEEWSKGRAEGVADYQYRLEQLEHDMYWQKIDFDTARDRIQVMIQDMQREG